MNLVGKVFVVAILVLSVVFMAFAMAVYATHKNWREVVMNERATPEKPLGLNQQLKNEQTRNETLKNELDKLTKDRDAVKADKDQAVAKLQSELAVVQEERKNLETKAASLEKEQREAVAAMNATQKSAADYRKELERLRTEVLQAQKDRDAHFKEVVRVTDELHQAINEKEQLRKRTEDITKDLAKAREALRYFDINESADYKSKSAPRIEAVVTATPGGGLVEISVGSDQGLRKGHLLEVYRTSGGASTYVGRIEVVKTTPDKSVCKVDPKFQNSNVMQGDRVASKID